MHHWHGPVWMWISAVWKSETIFSAFLAGRLDAHGNHCTGTNTMGDQPVVPMSVSFQIMFTWHFTPGFSDRSFCSHGPHVWFKPLLGQLDQGDGRPQVGLLASEGGSRNLLAAVTQLIYHISSIFLRCHFSSFFHTVTGKPQGPSLLWLVWCFLTWSKASKTRHRDPGVIGRRIDWGGGGLWRWMGSRCPNQRLEGSHQVAKAEGGAGECEGQETTGDQAYEDGAAFQEEELGLRKHCRWIHQWAGLRPNCWNFSVIPVDQCQRQTLTLPWEKLQLSLRISCQIHWFCHSSFCVCEHQQLLDWSVRRILKLRVLAWPTAEEPAA